MEKGLLIVISGPSGAGKGTIYGKVIAALPALWLSVSVTTRAPRDKEIDGVHYHFRSEDEYMRMKENGEFLETAEVYGHYYGTPLAPVMRALGEGKDALFEIDTVGAKQIKEKYPESIAIFIMPPSFEILEKRLRARGTEDEENLAKRIGSARSELAEYKRYDYIVFNDKAEVATQEVVEIINAHRNMTPQTVEAHTIANNEQTIRAILKQ